MTLGKYLRKKRLEKQWTQVELAKALGVRQNYVAYLENDQRKPSYEVLKKLAQNLNIPFDELFFLVHPDTKDHFSPMDLLFNTFRQNKSLLQQHAVTKNELKLLESVRARGKIIKEEDYIKLLETIRKVYQR